MINITKISNYFVSALYLNDVLYSSGQDIDKRIEELLTSYSGKKITFETIDLEDDVVMGIMDKFVARYPKDLQDLKKYLAKI